MGINWKREKKIYHRDYPTQSSNFFPSEKEEKRERKKTFLVTKKIVGMIRT